MPFFCPTVCGYSTDPLPPMPRFDPPKPTLFQRARVKVSREKTGGRKRTMTPPVVGDVFGPAKVVALLGQAYSGRSEMCVEMECLVCGFRWKVDEYNARHYGRSTRMRCAHKRTHG